MQGWSFNDYFNWVNADNEYLNIHGNDSYDNRTHNVFTPTFVISGNQSFEMVSFDVYTDWRNQCDYSYRLYISVNGGEYQEIHFEDCEFSWTEFEYDLTEIATGATSIRFMFGIISIGGDIWVLIISDLRTSLYPGYDFEFLHDESNDAYLGIMVHTLSTGGLTLIHSTFQGDFHSVSDSLQINLSNSTIEKNGARAKNSHGLGLYANHVEIVGELNHQQSRSRRSAL